MLPIHACLAQSNCQTCLVRPFMSALAYTNEELSRLDDHAFPERGTYCPKCRNYIPTFAAMDANTEQRLREGRLRSMFEVRRLTGCNLIFAKIWVIHPNGPHPERFGPPCPYCGSRLFSEGTRQCIQCGWDWHDPSNPVQHVVALRSDRGQRLEAEGGSN